MSTTTRFGAGALLLAVLSLHIFSLKCEAVTQRSTHSYPQQFSGMQLLEMHALEKESHQKVARESVVSREMKKKMCALKAYYATD